MTEGEGDKWRIIIILDRAAVTPRWEYLATAE